MANNNHSHPDVPLLSPSPTFKIPRTGEIKYLRWFLIYWAPVTHALLSISLALSLLYVLDEKQLPSSARTTYLPYAMFKYGTRDLRPSDITTMVSASLVLGRLVAGYCMVSGIWRCAIILLEHDGLHLHQLSNMIGYRIPTAWSGRYTGCTAIVLVMMLPSTLIAPLLSGSVNWFAVVCTGYDHTSSGHNHSTTLSGGFGSLRRYEGEYSYAKQWDDVFDPTMPSRRSELLMRAIGFFSTGWSPDEVDFRENRYIANQEAVINTTVFDVPMPYIEIHSLTWDKVVDTWVKEIVKNQTLIMHARDPPWPPGHQVRYFGSTILFGENNSLPTGLPSGPPQTITTSKKISVLSGDPRMDGGCLGDVPRHWDNVDQLELLAMGGFNCWIVGTVNFTVGIRYHNTCRYRTKQTVEALSAEPAKTKSLQGDHWSEFAITMLSEVLTTIPIVRLHRLETRNLTQYALLNLQQGYISMRSALEPYEPQPPDLQAEEPVTYLQASIVYSRVLSWLTLSLLLPASVIILWWMENSYEGRISVVDTALVPLLTDVREILTEDTNGVSNMSYLTKKDKKNLGKLQLRTIKIKGGPTVLGLTKARA